VITDHKNERENRVVDDSQISCYNIINPRITTARIDDDYAGGRDKDL